MKTIYLEEEKEKKTDKPSEGFEEKLLKTRQIILSGEINKELAEKIVKNLLVLEAESKNEPIYVYIDSPGGDVDAGFAVFDAMRFIEPCVFNIGMGLIASAAALILLAVPKERRLSLPNSRYLIHQPSSGMKGVATDIEIHAREMEKTKLIINEIIACETGQNLEKVKEDTERDYWLSAKEASEYGLVSRIIKTRNEL